MCRGNCWVCFSFGSACREAAAPWTSGDDDDPDMTFGDGDASYRISANGSLEVDISALGLTASVV